MKYKAVFIMLLFLALITSSPKLKVHAGDYLDNSTFSIEDRQGPRASLDNLQTENVFIIVLDGLRFKESFNDPEHQYIPNIWNVLRPQGTILMDLQTTTLPTSVPGHYTILTGQRDIFQNTRSVSNETSNNLWRPRYPTIFEYYRKEFNTLPETTFFVVANHLIHEGNYSLHPIYGSDYGAIFAERDAFVPYNNDPLVFDQVKDVMDDYHPNIFVINFSDIDSRGHDKTFEEYTDAIVTADQYVLDLWKKIQVDPIYKDKTTMMVLTDHGRHDDFHGGVGGLFDHGVDLCDGDRRIFFLAIGPDIKKGQAFGSFRNLTDIAPTVGLLLGFDTPFATGKPICEIFKEECISNDGFEYNSRISTSNEMGNEFLHLLKIKSNVSEQVVYSKLDGDVYVINEKQLSNRFTLTLNPEILTQGSRVHAVFTGWLPEDGTYINHEDWQNIYYTKSMDAGESWTEPIEISGYPNVFTTWRGQATLAAEGELVVAVYPTDTTYLVVNVSEDNGSNWNGFNRVDFGGLELVFPRHLKTVIRRGTIYTVYYDLDSINSDEGSLDIYFTKSDGDYTIWTQPVRLTTNSKLQINPDIGMHKGRLHVVWQDYSNDLWQISYKRSSDKGVSWSEDVALSEYPMESTNPKIVSNSDMIVVAWIGFSGGSGAIYFTYSDNVGIGWQDPQKVTALPESENIKDFDMAIGEQSIYFSWDDNGFTQTASFEIE